MTDKSVAYFPKYFTRKSILAFVLLTILIFLLFLHRAIPLHWLTFDFVEVLLFFSFSSTLSLRWSKLSTPAFISRLYKTAFFVRVIWVLFSYFFYNWMTGQPFEFSAADSLTYHYEATWLVTLLKNNQWSVYSDHIGKNYSDMGYPLYLGLIYYTFGNYLLIPRLIKALLGSLTCILVYKIARNNFGENTGRIAGIMSMLVPNLIYYCGLNLKEIEMVFLVVLFVYQVDLQIRSREIKLTYLILIGGLGVSLFFFRTVLAGCLFCSLAIATFLTNQRITGLGKRLGLIVLLTVGAFFIATTPFGDNINQYIEASDQNLTSQMDNFATREGANKLARYGSRGIFLPFMLMAPFPTLVNIPDQPNAMMLGGAYFTRNVYAFFVFIGLFALYKRKQVREHILLLSVIFSYIFVLASSGFALSERFHLPLVPFLLILAAYGISQMNAKNKKYYVPYLVLICVIVIGWNWFKLAGRS
ncbi:glycosyltransferase family 39 protein [Larkinella punicea]|uniref:Glycosyltransferase RgtA/B/C/D-like domain-containing protein n=1 Tax=Larkinella punicea TaxID=2315727 RepID=A0A368JLS1_9BACT|nr:glycosyltransferase family 39 protein [Larkinella punicea]RCR67614.1 hypothetical protein DUE52_21155 [Larkinella punicea]